MMEANFCIMVVLKMIGIFTYMENMAPLFIRADISPVFSFTAKQLQAGEGEGGRLL